MFRRSIQSTFSVWRFQNQIKVGNNSHEGLLSIPVQLFPCDLSGRSCSSQDNPRKTTIQKLKPSIQDTFKEFSDQDSDIIMDVDEEKNIVQEMVDISEVGNYLYRGRKPSQRNQELEKLNLNRGQMGVFDLEDLVQALKLEKVADIAAIKIPPENRYCDFMVIGTIRNPKHMRGTLEFIKKLHKLKKLPEDPHLPGEIHDRQFDMRKSSWQVMDMGYIVLHLFLSNIRPEYDLETLWTVGPKFDEKTIRPAYDPIVDMMQKHMSFMENLSANKSS